MNRRHFLWIGPLAALSAFFALQATGLAYAPAATAAVTLLTVIWWVSEALPIPATSIVPFALLPLVGVIDQQGVASALGSHVIVLLMGAFMLSKALERSGVHRRLAIGMVTLVGTHSARRLLFGFMIASALLSMWISNTATTLIMLPIALAVLEKVDNHRLRAAVVLGIAYAASIGGVGTPVGTPPNVIFMGIYEEVAGRSFGFLEWMQVGVPVVLVALPVAALWLSRGLKLERDLDVPEAGAWRTEERRMLIAFGLTILAWITRSEPFGGWSGLFGVEGVGDSTVALAAVIAMFLIPNGRGGRLLDWPTANAIPWGMLLLFAGGIAIAKAFVSSGLSQLMGDWLASLAGMPILLLLMVVCLLVTYLTEITSNTATATLLMPILAAAAVGAGLPPELLMIPAAICASCAFMLPVATAPNAIVFGSGEVRMQEMVRQGAVLSFLVALLVALVCHWLLA
ncbi:MAG: SLC13 family permease [Lysobacteraceae bacterium]